MKHAILVIGYGNKAPILQQCIKILDNEKIDFYINWDKKYSLPTLKSQRSKIFFIKNRTNVKWGSYSQIKAEKELIKCIDMNKYRYIHLISSNDMPLMTSDYFINYFIKDAYIGFDYPTAETAKKRLQYYYPNYVDFRKHKICRIIWTAINRVLRVNRLKGKEIEVFKGCNWFSLRSKYIPQLLLPKFNSIFEHTFCGDEEFVQTILNRFYDKEDLRDDCTQAARYIDWKRGRPYIFRVQDVPELAKKVNTKYAFARKVDNPLIITKVFNCYSNNIK